MATYSTHPLANGNTLTLVEVPVIYCGERQPTAWEVIERDDTGSLVQVRRYENREAAAAWIEAWS